MADKLEELQAEGHGALIFSQFIGGLDQMEAVAKERGIDYLRMDGRTPVSKRKEIVRLFQKWEGPCLLFYQSQNWWRWFESNTRQLRLSLRSLVESCGRESSQRPRASYRSDPLCFRPALIMQHSIEARMLELKARKAELFKQLVEEPSSKSAKQV